MSGLLFQHIREFRSLAYSTYGMLIEPDYISHADRQPAFVTVTGTQADKSVQVAETVDSLLRFMPVKEENMLAARQELLSAVQNGYPSFRGIGFYVANDLAKGYTADHNTQRVQLLPALTVADVERYHRQHVAQNQRVWFVIGDRKLTDLQSLGKFGKVIELKQEDIYNK